MNKPLCETCMNKDSAYVLHGPKYVEEEICIYGMSRFPNMHNCSKFEQSVPPEEEVA